MRDRDAHIGRSEAGCHRSVSERNETMHNRLSMNEKETSSRSPFNPEKIMRLNHFETLVHKAGLEIDGNLRSHRPIGMFERLFGCCHRNLLACPGPERSAGCGQGHGFDRVRIGIAQRLEDRVMLAVDRQQPRPHCGGLTNESRSGTDKTVFLGESNCAAS